MIQELSAIVPAKEKHNIVKTAISKVHTCCLSEFKIAKCLKLLRDICMLLNLYYYVNCSSVRQSSCNLTFIGLFTTLELFWLVLDKSFLLYCFSNVYLSCAAFFFLLMLYGFLLHKRFAN